MILDSVNKNTRQIAFEGEKDWRIHFFNWVDAFRYHKDLRMVKVGPCKKASPKIKALFASATEYLCDEMQLEKPTWVRKIGALQKPWFVSELKGFWAIAFAQSPVRFRQRLIFVCKNFMFRV